MLDFEVMRRSTGIKPRASCDGEFLDWYEDAKGYAGQMDAPEYIAAGSTMGRTPVAPARGRRVCRGKEPAFESNPLIYAA